MNFCTTSARSSDALASVGCDIATVQALARHKSIKTTQRYLGTSTQLRREAVNRLNFAEAKADGASTDETAVLNRQR